MKKRKKQKRERKANYRVGVKIIIICVTVVEATPRRLGSFHPPLPGSTAWRAWYLGTSRGLVAFLPTAGSAVLRLLGAELLLNRSVRP